MRNNIIIKKIIEYIDRIFDYTAGATMHTFSNNTMMLEACVFCLSQIGELVNNMDDGFKERYPDIPWFNIANLRNRIVHDYEGVKILLIWDIIKNDLSDLKSELKKLV
ncbi:MAG: DUF86 domain-containing protein [Clostridiales Family XIII bacterium]|jgi:uncharacterized protein with HEPN domain|nr:DUF86 domain-containing protein [Clostridiales Family XIII bacterium]